MIISASRRTDIPSCYSEWFYNRIKAGCVMVRNPMNMHQVSQLSLSPDVVDCIVFWTKNPAPMLEKLYQLNDYSYYFQFTLNSYGKDIEPKIPSKNDEIIKTFRRLSDKIGADRVIWRYDPILISKNYNIEYHANYFEKLARHLHGYTRKCTISFIDLYRNTQNNLKDLYLHTLTSSDMHLIAEKLSEVACSYGLKLDTCAESLELDDIKVSHARCIDDRLIEKITGYSLNIGKDRNQRLECGCVESIDIGAYNTCLNACKYCYANHSTETAKKNFACHDVDSPLLCGTLSEKDKVTERAVRSYKESQLSMFADS